MFNTGFDVVWGEIVPFDKPEKKLFMVYYGFCILGLFVGCSHLLARDKTPKPGKMRSAFA